jgi:dihydrolipoyl dehydrogenase
VYDLIVIGAGPGGYEAAIHAGRLGRKVMLVEKDRIGGACLNVGCIPAKAFLRSSRLTRECHAAASFGLQVGEVKLDLPMVIERKDRIVAGLASGIASLLEHAHVDVRAGHARIVARDQVQVGCERTETANILIATGSRPAVPPIPGIDSALVIDSTAAFDRTDIPARVAIIGAGCVGLEFATFFSDVGSDVTVFEALPRIAAGWDRDVADRLRKSLQRRGITFHLSCQVAGIDGGVIRFSDGQGSVRTCEADCILSATGRDPVVADLGLEDVGVDFSADGVRVTDHGKTNVPSIWACGDVTGQHMFAHVATREGIVAVDNMFSRSSRMRYGALPAVIYTHPEAASAGRTEEELKAAGIGYKKTTVPMSVAGRFRIENEHENGFLKLLTGAIYGELLGVHALGDLSSEFIIAASALIGAEVSVQHAAELVFPHPTVSEALREAIRRARDEAES